MEVLGGNQNIKVVCRVRPLKTDGKERESARCLTISDDKLTISLVSKGTSASVAGSNASSLDNRQSSINRFTFDLVAGEDSSQQYIFDEIGIPTTKNCLSGYNGTLICYGQTGTGKSHTIFGTVDQRIGGEIDPGIVPRAIKYIWSAVALDQQCGAAASPPATITFDAKCSFFEIYQEKVFDLLDSSPSSNSNNLQVREDPKKGVFIEGITEVIITSPQDADAVLSTGYKNRHVGETAMNRESSRSHAVFVLSMQRVEVKAGVRSLRKSKFSLVDLAGSERQKDTQSTGDRLKEASVINKSLSTLGKVINTLATAAAASTVKTVPSIVGGKRSAEDAPTINGSASCRRGSYVTGNGSSPVHVPYRESKLTFLLRDSLGGNSKTVLIATLSPSELATSENVSTLQFAARAKTIKTAAVCNEESSLTMMLAMQSENTMLKEKIVLLEQALKNAQGMAHSYQRKISIVFQNQSDTTATRKHANRSFYRKKGQYNKDPLVALLPISSSVWEMATPREIKTVETSSQAVGSGSGTSSALSALFPQVTPDAVGADAGAADAVSKAPPFRFSFPPAATAGAAAGGLLPSSSSMSSPLKQAKSWFGPAPAPLRSLFSATSSPPSTATAKKGRRSSLPEGRDFDSYAQTAQGFDKKPKKVIGFNTEDAGLEACYAYNKGGYNSCFGMSSEEEYGVEEGEAGTYEYSEKYQHRDSSDRGHRHIAYEENEYQSYLLPTAASNNTAPGTGISISDDRRISDVHIGDTAGRGADVDDDQVDLRESHDEVEEGEEEGGVAAGPLRPARRRSATRKADVDGDDGNDGNKEQPNKFMAFFKNPLRIGNPHKKYAATVGRPVPVDGLNHCEEEKDKDIDNNKRSSNSMLPTTFGGLFGSVPDSPMRTTASAGSRKGSLRLFSGLSFRLSHKGSFFFRQQGATSPHNSLPSSPISTDTMIIPTTKRLSIDEATQTMEEGQDLTTYASIDCRVEEGDHLFSDPQVVTASTPSPTADTTAGAGLEALSKIVLSAVVEEEEEDDDAATMALADDAANSEVDSIPEAQAASEAASEAGASVAAASVSVVSVLAGFEDNEEEGTWRLSGCGGTMDDSKSSRCCSDKSQEDSDRATVTVTGIDSLDPIKKYLEEGEEEKKGDFVQGAGERDLHDIMGQRNSLLPGSTIPLGTCTNLVDRSAHPPVEGAVLLNGVWYTPYVVVSAPVPAAITAPVAVTVSTKKATKQPMKDTVSTTVKGGGGGGWFICFSS